MLQGLESNALPEISPQLQIEGDVVRVRRDKSPRSNLFGLLFDGQDNQVFVEITPAASFDIDDRAGLDNFTDAVVLIEWNDAQKKTKMRFVMMLLKWVTDDMAERIGILSEYRHEWNAGDVGRIERTKKRFFLQ